MRNAWKYGRWCLLGGVLMQFGGCIGGILNALWVALPAYLGTELLLDNSGLIDIFTDPG